MLKKKLKNSAAAKPKDDEPRLPDGRLLFDLDLGELVDAQITYSGWLANIARVIQFELFADEDCICNDCRAEMERTAKGAY